MEEELQLRADEYGSLETSFRIQIEVQIKKESDWTYMHWNEIYGAVALARFGVSIASSR